MFKVKNNIMANKTIGISSETVSFDTDGIGVIKSEAIYESVLKLRGFTAVDIQPEPVVEIPEPKIMAEPIVEPIPEPVIESEPTVESEPEPIIEPEPVHVDVQPKVEVKPATKPITRPAPKKPANRR